MKDIMTVFAFTFRDNIRKKVFIITTIIVLILIFAASSIPAIMGYLQDKPETDDKQSYSCYVVDKDGLVPTAIPVLKAQFPKIKFISGEPQKAVDYKKSIASDKTKAMIEIIDNEGIPSLRFTITDFLSGTPTTQMTELLRNEIVRGMLSKEGVSEATTGIVLSGIVSEVIPTGKMDVTGYALGIVLTMVMFFAIYFYGYGVAMSVASEKTSRVMETLIVSAKPSRILLGKCIAMGALGLLQLTIFIVAAAGAYKFIVPADFTIAGVPLALSSFTPTSALLILVYFLLGYSLFAMINSVCGATVSRAEDLQSAMTPSILISMISFYSAYVVMFMPDPGIRRIVSCIPFTSPFIMPFRLLNESLLISDIIISICILIVAIVIVSALSIRLYSASVLHYGQRLKLGDLFKLSR
ncbi:MAG: ABC transporter permease [Oscillospiraceae bacterium]|nr:ABC transporter permease [Oscillospiraceae bacterium]MDD4413863.1 ABC transporter permease [Oscillospiraceae bacterium]